MIEVKPDRLSITINTNFLSYPITSRDSQTLQNNVKQNVRIKEWAEVILAKTN